MTNTNCLEGVRCPACGNKDRFYIVARIHADVTDDGADIRGDVDWDDDSVTECAGCSRSGLLKDFRGEPAAKAEAAGHTPPPWAYEEETGRVYFADGEVEPTIAFVDLENTSPVRAKADGHLIAAAPKLLAALTWLLDDLSDAGEDRDPATGKEYDSVAFARTALAEAKAAGGPTSDIASGTPRPYSVLLLYPDYANDDGTETYYTWVAASDPVEAVAAAQRQAVAANDCVDIDPGDFVPLLAIEGHYHGLPMSNA